jgi:ribonuclease HI
MVYIMEFYVDGGCRGNGSSWATGAAACVMMKKSPQYYSWTMRLPSDPTPTNQRAELTAIIMALELALDRYNELDGNPWLDVTIYSDSQYAVNCMNEWIYKWANNGWNNARGCEVANRDLIEEASNLDDKLKAEGKVKYVWIPREKNELADRLCNEELDK